MTGPDLRRLLGHIKPRAYRSWYLDMEDTVGRFRVVVWNGYTKEDYRQGIAHIEKADVERAARTGDNGALVRLAKAAVDLAFWLADRPRWWGRISRKHERLRPAEVRP